MYKADLNLYTEAMLHQLTRHFKLKVMFDFLEARGQASP